jgi:ubiquinone/menaquinone biosynthesis C-methylase UbiE
LSKDLDAFCPTCEAKTQYLIDWKFGGLNDSIFNYSAIFFKCPSCGLVYIENISDEQLSIFYSDECNYSEKTHFNIISPKNIEKYNYYKNFIMNLDLFNVSITDVGCGRGGFLLWLKKNNWNANCFGVDIDLKSIPENNQNNGDNARNQFIFKEGTAVSLPFVSNTQEFLTYFHVLEHIRNVDAVLQEASRVLKADGYILIEVPDAEHYEDYPVGTAFWISIREHVNHFSVCAISQALRRNGFSVIRINRGLLPTPEFEYPSLMILAKKSKGNDDLGNCKGQDIASYVKKSHKELINQVNFVLALHRKFSSITFWGCSAELFSLLPLLDIKDFTLCDSNKLKQESNYQGIPIQDPKTVQITGALIIAPYLYADAIEIDARKLGWPNNAIFQLK